MSHLKAFFYQTIKEKQQTLTPLLETRHLQMHSSGQTAGLRLKAFFTEHQKTTNSLNCFTFPLMASVRMTNFQGMGLANL